MERPTRKISAEVHQRAARLLPLVVILLVLAGLLQTQIDPLAKQYRPKTNDAIAYGGLTNEFLLLPLLGFREAAAGLLWVRCDEFFHSGDYDAILPLVRLVTWLDPHADNVYITGAWHLAYNFTDSNERSDRRYIAPSQGLLNEGIANNMHLWEVKFEKGWQLYDKIKDYASAVEAFDLALATKPLKGSQEYPYGAPLKAHHSKAHSLARMGRIPEALAEWRKAIERSTKQLAEAEKTKNPDMYGLKQMLSAEQHNYDITLQRFYDRYTRTNHSNINPSPYPAVLRPSPDAPNTPRQWDIGFQTKVEVTRDRVFRVSGKFNTADGARVDVRIMDWNYKQPKIPDTLVALGPGGSTATILQDMISVRKNRFEREIDMSKDPRMYSFQSEDGFYRIELSFNPHSTSPHIQDRFGYNGEGFTDTARPEIIQSNEDPREMGTRMIEIPGMAGQGPLWDGKQIPWGQFGQPWRTVKVVYKIDREQVRGARPITDKDIVPAASVPQ